MWILLKQETVLGSVIIIIGYINRVHFRRMPQIRWAICTSLQTDNYASSPPRFFTGRVTVCWRTNSVKALKTPVTGEYVCHCLPLVTVWCATMEHCMWCFDWRFAEHSLLAVSIQHVQWVDTDELIYCKSDDGSSTLVCAALLDWKLQLVTCRCLYGIRCSSTGCRCCFALVS